MTLARYEYDERGNSGSAEVQISVLLAACLHAAPKPEMPDKDEVSSTSSSEDEADDQPKSKRTMRGMLLQYMLYDAFVRPTRFDSSSFENKIDTRFAFFALICTSCVLRVSCERSDVKSKTVHLSPFFSTTCAVGTLHRCMTSEESTSGAMRCCTCVRRIQVPCTL